MTENKFILLGSLVTGISIFILIPVLGHEVVFWQLIASAVIGGLLAGVLVLLAESIVENIILVGVLLVLSSVLSNTKPGLAYIFIAAVIAGVLGVVFNQLNQYLKSHK